jgi:hypothetical protein
MPTDLVAQEKFCRRGRAKARPPWMGMLKAKTWITAEALVDGMSVERLERALPSIGSMKASRD